LHDSYTQAAERGQSEQAIPFNGLVTKVSRL